MSPPPPGFTAQRVFTAVCPISFVQKKAKIWSHLKRTPFLNLYVVPHNSETNYSFFSARSFFLPLFHWTSSKSLTTKSCSMNRLSHLKGYEYFTRRNVVPLFLPHQTQKLCFRSKVLLKMHISYGITTCIFPPSLPSFPKHPLPPL